MRLMQEGLLKTKGATTCKRFKITTWLLKWIRVTEVQVQAITEGKEKKR